MKHTLTALVMGIAFCTSASALAQSANPDCMVSGSDMSAFSALDYDAFNYGPDGWRKLSSEKCYYDAGASIISWLLDHDNELDDAQRRTQHYQAARNFALADRKPIAVLQLRQAQDQGDVKLGAMNWNAYLDVFDAWLSSDRTAMDAAITRLERQAVNGDGHKPNLAAARRFARCFDKSYIMIEQDPSCLPEPTPTSGAR